MHTSLQQNAIRPFTCRLCNSTFNRASQLDYHHRNTHLKEKSQICQFCDKGFFRKADLRTHLNIHLGTNYCICEICGRKFNHMSNLIRHSRMHSGIKPYPCLICGKRFTQISSLVRHKRMHAKTSEHSYNTVAKHNALTLMNDELLRKQKICKRQHYCQVCGESFCFIFLLREHQKSHNGNIKQTDSKYCIKNSSTMSDAREVNHDKQDSTTSNYVDDHNKQMCIVTDNNEEQTQVIQGVIYISSEQVPDVNPEEVYISSNQLLNHHTKLSSGIKIPETESDSNISINISEVLSSYNCEQIGSLYNEINTLYPAKVDKNTKLVGHSSLNEGFVDKREAMPESCEQNKDEEISFDENQLCVETPEYKYKTKVAKESFCNEKHPEAANIVNNMLVNCTEPTLRLIQTETGEQFYELVMNTFPEKLPDSYRKLVSNTKKTDNNIDKVEYSLDNLINITHDFNNALCDLQDDARGFNTVAHENEHLLYVSLRNKDFSVDITEKDSESIQALNLHQLGGEQETDFENYVKSSFEVLERGNYDNNAERFFELIEIAEDSLKADVNVSYGQTPISLMESGNEQFFQLLDTPQGDPRVTYKLNDDVSAITLNKSDTLSCSENSGNLNISTDAQSVKNLEEKNTNEFVKSILTNSYNEELDNHVQNANKTKGLLKKFQCSVCQKFFSTAYSFKQHMGTHFTDQQKFRCKECEISFAWKSTLNKHIANNHRSDGPQRFACESCTKVYRTLSQEHVKRDHLKQRDHVCLYCGKSFFKKFDLKTHSRTHTDERPYVCRACGKTFHHQSHIIRHERIHSGERPYACNFCHKSFTQPGSLKVHKQKHRERKIDILDCQMDEDDPIILGKL